MPSHMQRIVIQETRRSPALVKVFTGLALLAIAAAVVGLGPGLLGTDPVDGPLKAALAGLAVTLVGAGTLSTWRNSGEREVLECAPDRIRLLHSLAQGPLYDAAVANTRLQRFVAPGGQMQLFLRDGVRAVEIGRQLGPGERNRMAERLEALLKS